MRGVVLLACAASLAAQESRFDVRSRLVLVPVTITDPNGRSVAGLEASDFQVFDNGRPQKAAVDTIDTGVAPIALVIAVQSSGISAAALEKTRRIASMIQPLVTGERGCAGLVSFAGRITWLQDCTNDEDALDRAFHQLRPSLGPGEEKKARMLDAVQSAVEHLRAKPYSRRVLLLISEARDRGSETALEVAAVAAQAAGVAVYSATYSAFKTAFTSKAPVSRPPRQARPKAPNDEMGTHDGQPSNKYNPKIPPPEQRVDLLAALGELSHLRDANTAEVLAKSTGGETFSFTRQKALENAIQKLGTELHAEYVLSFAPSVTTPGYHTIEVRLARAGEFRIRARPGYWSTEESR